MRLAQHTIWIARTPEEVFDFFIDFSQAPRWRQYVRTMELTGAPPVRAGSQVHVTMDLSGGAYAFDLEVLVCQRPSLWRHRTHESDFSGFIEYHFEPDHAGTRVTMTMKATPRGPLWLARSAAHAAAANLRSRTSSAV